MHDKKESICIVKHRFCFLVEPVLPVLPPNITANQSERVELNCHADANPPVTRYNWTKDGNVLSETGPSYVIPSAQVSCLDFPLRFLSKIARLNRQKLEGGL